MKKISTKLKKKKFAKRNKELSRSLMEEVDLLNDNNNSEYGEDERYISMEEITFDGDSEEEKDLLKYFDDNGEEPLRMTNIAWKSWIPRLALALLFIFGGCVILGLTPQNWNIGLVCTLLGCFFLFKTKAETYTFDKRLGTFYWTRRNVLGVSKRTFDLADITDVRLVNLVDYLGGVESNLYLIFRGGQKMKMFSGQLISPPDKSDEKAREKILHYLLGESSGEGLRERNQDESFLLEQRIKSVMLKTGKLSRRRSERPRRKAEVADIL